MAEADADEPMTGAGYHYHRKPSFAQIDHIKYRRAFDSFNAGRTGSVATNDLVHIVAKLGYRMKEEQIKEILANTGLGDVERVTFEQFLDVIPRNTDQISDDEHKLAELREKFQRYDLDQNGMISLQEAQVALQVELKVCPQTALRLLNQFVQLNYEQFMDFYKQVQDKKMEIYDKFGKYDTDKDGMISVEEAHAVLRQELGFSAERSKAMVDKFDFNHDGLVSYVEFAEFYIAVEERKNNVRKMFRRFDPEGQGFVTYEHAQEILGNLFGFSAEKCQKTVEAYDTKKDGKLDYEEFLDFYSMLEHERQRLLEEFDRYDLDKDGRISYGEFKNMLSDQGYSVKEVDTLMAGYDLNQDGFLDFDEFKRYLNFSS